MSQNIKANIKTKNVLWGIATFFIVSVLGTVIYSILLLKDNIPDTAIATVTTVIFGISAGASGIVSGIMNKCKGIKIGFVNGILQTVLLLLFSIIFRENSSIFTAENLIKLIVIILCSAVGGIIGVNFKRKY